MGTLPESFLRWGIVGIGRHARRFMAPAILQSTKSKLVAVCSRDLQRARHFGEEYDCGGVYDSLHDMLADDKVNAVYVGSPNHVHKEHVLQIAQARKHILCDKPLANYVEESLAMVDACKEAGIKLGVGFHLRHNPAHIMTREIVLSGEIGELVLAEIQYMHVTAGAETEEKIPLWRQDPRMAGGGSFIGTGVHAIDLLRFVSGREITAISAVADESWYNSGVEHIIQASLRLEGDVVASLSGGDMKYPLNYMTLYGKKGMLHCTGSIGYYGGGKLELVSDRDNYAKEFDRCDVYLKEIDAFADSIQFNTEPNADGYDGLRASEVTVGIYEALRTKSVVVLRP